MLITIRNYEKANYISMDKTRFDVEYKKSIKGTFNHDMYLHGYIFFLVK